MNLSELKECLGKVENVNFKVDNDGFIPQHFHVTEFGLVTKDFIDCGGTSRSEKM